MFFVPQHVYSTLTGALMYLHGAGVRASCCYLPFQEYVAVREPRLALHKEQAETAPDQDLSAERALGGTAPRFRSHEARTAPDEAHRP